MKIKGDLLNLVLGLIEDKTIINSEVTVLGNITIEKIDGRVYYTIEKVCFYFTDGILDSMNKINEIYVLLFLISEIYQMNAFDKENFAFLNFYILTEKETNRLFLNCDDGNGKILVSYALNKESELQGLDLLIGLNFHFYMQYGVLMLAQEY